jgi:N-acetylmuramoyl-L-alanine amidase
MVAREEIITSSNADIFVSIHQNAFDNPDVKGPEVYYNMNSDSGKYLAEYIQNSLDTKLEVVKSRGIRAAEHRLTKYLPYSVLIECGYLTNPAEEALLVSNEYQMKVAEAIFEGINKFFEEFYG